MQHGDEEIWTRWRGYLKYKKWQSGWTASVTREWMQCTKLCGKNKNIKKLTLFLAYDPLRAARLANLAFSASIKIVRIHVPWMIKILACLNIPAIVYCMKIYQRQINFLNIHSAVDKVMNNFCYLKKKNKKN